MTSSAECVVVILDIRFPTPYRNTFVVDAGKSRGFAFGPSKNDWKYSRGCVCYPKEKRGKQVDKDYEQVDISAESRVNEAGDAFLPAYTY